jgi:hypothetical protein
MRRRRRGGPSDEQLQSIVDGLTQNVFVVIEAVTGNSMGQEMDRLFEQAGMDHSYYAPGVTTRRELPRCVVRGSPAS